MNLMSMKKLKIEKYKKESVFAETKDFDYLAKEHDFVEITEWKNGEGYDITLSDKQIISITDGQFRAIKKLIKKLNK